MSHTALFIRRDLRLPAAA